MMRITTTIPGYTHYRWVVARNYRTMLWCVQPTRRTRVGTGFGPPVATFDRKVDAQADARARNERGRPVDSDFERPRHGVEVRDVE